jgi:DNA repair protein RadC
MAKRKTAKMTALAEQPLTSDDTYERGVPETAPVPPAPAPKPCSCHTAPASPPAEPTVLVAKTVSVEKATATQVDMLAEPMVAIAEPRPRTLRIERVNGAGAFETVREVEMPEYAACDSPACLPYVRIERDPDKFRKCLAIAQSFGPIKDSNKLYDYLKQTMTAQDQEVLIVIMFDTHLLVRGVGVLARGARDRVSVPIPDVLRLPLVNGATAFAVAHNHPSGSPTPSQADEHLTKALLEASKAVNVDLFDHIVVGADGYYSFRANKWKRNGKAIKRS